MNLKFSRPPHGGLFFDLNKKRKILLIGWDAADWDVIDQLMEQGKMPALKTLIEKGVRGKLSTFDPPVSPMLWTSIATGKYPEKHGILGFVEPSPDGKGLRPLLSTSRKVKAIWNILNQNEYKTNVIGWWPSHPAEPVNGAMVSNFYQMVTVTEKENWKMDDGTVYPPELAPVLEELRMHPSELTFAHILPFIPQFSMINQENDKTAEVVAKLISHGSCIQNAATWLMDNREWDFTAVYFDMIDHFSHLGMRYRPPYRESVSKEMFDKYNGLVDAAYMLQDMMLEAKLSMVDDDTLVMLISDHGFHSDHLRPLYYPKEPAGPTFEHSPFGIIVISGPGIKKNERIYGASVMDITPTLLTYLGLPLGKDMDGKPLLQCFEGKIIPQYIESWEDVNEGYTGMHSRDKRMDAWAENEAMKQLIELGYIEKPEGNAEEQVEKARKEALYFQARNHMFNRKFEKAVELLEEISAKGNERYMLLLAQCYLELKRLNDCNAIIETLLAREKSYKSFLWYLKGRVLIAQQRAHKSIDYFKKAMEYAPRSAELFTQTGFAHLACARYEKAEENFLTALEIDKKNVSAAYGLGVSQLKQERFEEATDHLLETVELRNYFPQAHYQLGVALTGLGEYEHAANAFQYALQIAPGMLKAHEQLVKLYSDYLQLEEKAKYHQQVLDEKNKGEIIVVSGLNRSGRTVAMQILKAAGISLLADDENGVDSKKTGTLPVSGWLEEAKGKAVKLDPAQLMDLPSGYNYKLIWMERNINEVLASQQKVAGLPGYKQNAFPSGLDIINKNQMRIVDDWMKNYPLLQPFFLDFNELMKDPGEELKALALYLGIQDAGKLLDTRVINRELYKERRG